MKNNKDKSKFIRFCVGAVAILLVCATCFTFLIFQTDAVFEVAMDSQNRFVDFERMSVTTIIEEADSNSGSQPGMGDGNTGGGTMPGLPGGNTGGQVTLNPVQGDKIVFPNVGDTIDYVEINTGVSGSLPRASKDTLTWEFVYDYISTTSEGWLQRMKGRAAVLAPYIVPSNPEDASALVVELNNERLYVGCWPVDTGNPLGSIAEFTMSDGSKFKVLCVDAKSCNDAKGSGSNGQCNTSYAHAMLTNSNTELSLSAIELWGKQGISGTSKCTGFPDVMTGKTVVSAELVSHTNLPFN